MNIYDEFIKKTMNLLGGKDIKILDKPINKNYWQDAGKYNLILKNEMAYELGGGNLSAVVGLGVTSSKELIDKDEVLLYGPDLPNIKNDISYGRITFIRVDDSEIGEGDVAYLAIRKMEYTRYHTNPKGYMMRISVVNEREPVRISKEALKDGLNFAKVGKMFIDGYHKDPKVKAVKIIFITQPNFPYEELNKLCGKAERITEALNEILKNLKMDCSACNLKSVCDEVEGLREMHNKYENSIN